MRSFIRTRYGCDFCKKVGGSAFHLRKHEAGCTNNPNRVCTMHKIAADCDPSLSVENLKQALAEGGFPFLESAADGCPACILSGLRQSWVAPPNGEPWPDEPQDGRQNFNFKSAVASMWDDYNSSRAADGDY